jgi:hypothetical protein
MAKATRHTNQPEPDAQGFTPAQREMHERALRRDRAQMRAGCTAFRFWRRCRKAGCRRAHACTGGDPQECFDRHWASFPQRAKVWLRAGIKARAAGRSLQDATRDADAELLRYAMLEERAPNTNVSGSRSADPTAPARTEKAPAPRLRAL